MMKGSDTKQEFYDNTLKPKNPKRHIGDDFSDFYEHVNAKNTNKTLISIGVIYCIEDKDVALQMLERLKAIGEEPGVRNYVQSADVSKMYLVKAPRFISGELKHDRNMHKM